MSARTSKGSCFVSFFILYWGTSEIVEDTEEESSYSGTKREGSEDEGPGSEDEGPVPTKDTAVNEPLRLGYGALRHRELVVREGEMPITFKVGQSSRSVPEHEGAEKVFAFKQPTLVTWVDPKDGRVYINISTYVPPAAPIQTPPSLEWSSGSLSVSPSSPAVPTPVALLVTTPASTIVVNDDEFLERENHDLRMHIAEERCERLELTDRVARMEKRQESRGE
ncbi:hypothetical protein Tco_1508806 [Tanacetum coccineum]